MIIAHIGGMPIEETLATGGPALLTALGVLGAQLRARRIGRRSTRGPVEPDAAPAPRADREARHEGILSARR